MKRFLSTILFLYGCYYCHSQATVEPGYILLGRDQLPTNGEIVSDTFFFFNASKGALRGGSPQSFNWSPDSLGVFSFSWGRNTIASGNLGATAIGDRTKATGGEGATALGIGSESIGDKGATALGYFTVASGNYGATALGYESEATGRDGATALGAETKAIGNYGATALGTNTEASGNFGATALGDNTKASGDDGATALGYATTASGDSGATALGFNTLASGGHGATSLGRSTRAMGNSGATALGNESEASGDLGATALGNFTEASGELGATALGSGTTASGSNGASALGSSTTASGDGGATALGNSTTASGNNGATALGRNTTASGNNGATALGLATVASGDNGATALGYFTEATGDNCTVIGRYNDTLVTAGSDVTPTSPLFIVGNGDFGSLTNAMVVRKNGIVSFENYTFPDLDGMSGQFLGTNGSGQLNWMDDDWDNNGSNLYRSTGSVIIGNPVVPAAKLEVNNPVASIPAAIFENAMSLSSAPAIKTKTLGTWRGAVFEIDNTSNNSAAIYGITNGIGTGLVVNHNGSAGNVAIFQSLGAAQARIDKTGKGFFNGGTQNNGADLAEAILPEGDIDAYEPGDVLVISLDTDRKVQKSSEPYSTLVIGVYATKPGVLLTEENIADDLSGHIPMGVVGIIPTKVCQEGGSIRRGDLLVTASLTGYAMKADINKVRPGQILGKALQNSEQDFDIIQVMVNVQ